MNHLLNVIVLYLILHSEVVLSSRIIKKVWIHKEFGHRAFHFEPISFIKEAIFPFGQLSVEHALEKRDLQSHEHIRKKREAEDIVFPNIENDSDAVIETQQNILNEDNLLTDIILTRVEFHKSKPIDAIKVHSIIFPDDTDGTQEGIVNAALIDTSRDLEAQESLKESFDSEHVPLKITEDTKTEGGDVSLSSVSDKLIEPNTDVEIISKTEEKVNSQQEKQPIEEVAPISKLEVAETTDDKPTIEDREIEEKQPEVIIENVELVSAKAEPIIEVTPPPEVPALAVSPLVQPVYIPLYTDVKIPVPEVISAAPSVVVVTETEVVVPPPVETETTVIQTEQTPGLFSRGSRFMLNVSSRLLKKLLRLVSRIQSRLTLPPPVDA